jgi:flavin-dependent thymidylate synthase
MAITSSNQVELIGFYGGDEAHALSAWTSTSRDLNDEKVKRIPALLAMLAKEGHHTPFEKSSLHFLVTCDIASHIHIIKHRIAVSVNAESARYKELKEDKAYIPTDWPEDWVNTLESHIATSQTLYHAALDSLTQTLGRKRAKESARFFLPYATKITSDVMFNFRSFMAFQKLRNDDHAQLEIHTIAQTMLDLVRDTRAFTHSLAGFGV